MFSLFKRPRAIELNVVNALELKKDCNYLLLADSRHISDKEMREMVAQARKVGVRNIVGFLMNGGDKDAVTLIDRPGRQRDKNGKFVKKGN